MGNIYEDLRRYEFNKTESETLTGLVEDAIDKGEGARKEQAILRKISADLALLLREANFFLEADWQDTADILEERTVGIDGSNQPVGGVGGKWYVPLSCAIVSFEKGLKSTPKIEVSSHIEIIQEREFTHVGTEAMGKMLLLETKAIMEYAMKGQRSTLFIDGPIVDPPTAASKDYVAYRCSAIKESLKRGINVIGCAKRVKDTHVRKFIESHLLRERRDKVKLEPFPSDLQLFAFVFAHHWHQVGGDKKGLYTLPVDVSDTTKVYKLYQKNEIRIFSTFIQKDLGEYILRLDVPFFEGEPTNEKGILEQFTQAVRATFAWTYPNQNIPLPIFLADNKCEIRRGCAEVLYDEIITRSRSTEPLDQMVSLQLEARL